jgi:hypothetical protein
MPNALACAVPECAAVRLATVAARLATVAARLATAAVRLATVALAGVVGIDGEVPD